MRAITAPPGTVGKLERLEITCKRGFDMSHARLNILSASLLLAACSGGGEDFTGAGGPTTEPTAITSANGVTATKAAWASVVASGDLSNLGGALPIASAPGDASIAASGQPGKFLLRVSKSVPFGPIVLECLQTGTITISGDASDPLAVDDTFRVESTMCDDGFGEVVDGIIDFTIRDVAGDVSQGAGYLLSMDAIVTNLQIANSTDTFLSNGDATVALDTTESPFIRAGSSGSSMTTDSSVSSDTISNYQSSQTVDGNLQTLPYTLSASGTLDTTLLEGTVDYSTPLEFSGEGNAFPSEGVLLVRGANSTARLIAVDNVNVTIEIDVNGDGVVDDTINTTWLALTD